MVYFKYSLSSIVNGVRILTVIPSYFAQEKLKVRSKDREVILELQAAILRLISRKAAWCASFASEAAVIRLLSWGLFFFMKVVEVMISKSTIDTPWQWWSTDETYDI